MDLSFTVLGLALLLGAGDALVRGAVALSLRLGIPALIVSLTVVAFGTSAPELLIGIQGALAGADGIVFGNVVGSNIANVLLVLGVPAVISGISPAAGEGRRDWLFMMGSSAVFTALCFLGPLVWWHGVILLAGLGAMLWMAFTAARNGRDAVLAAELAEIEEADPGMATWILGLLLGAGLVGLPLGAYLLIEGARGLASSWGLSEAAIGLTLVAVGTSLPELVTSVMAAIRRHADVAIGNVIGSNIFNLLAIMGVVSFIGPLEVPPAFLTLDLWLMLASSALLWACVYPGWVLDRRIGSGLLGLYAVYLLIVLIPRL